MTSLIDKLSTLLSQAMKRLSRMPGYTTLSAVGLIFSMSGTLIIARYLYQEWTIDHWMPDLDRTYMLVFEDKEGEQWEASYYKVSSHGVKLESPIDEQEEVECITGINLYHSLKLKHEHEGLIHPLAITADSMFHRFFPVKAAEGSLHLHQPGEVILSETLAARLFPNEEAVGQTLTTEDDEVKTVIGVFRQPYAKNSLHFDYIEYHEGQLEKTNAGHLIYLVRLRRGTDADAFNRRQPFQQTGEYASDAPIRFQLLPYKEGIAKGAGRVDVIQSKSSDKYLWMLLAVGILLFLVGIFNFLNLYAVMRHTREHEMKVRRFFGASRWNIFSMLYVESLLISAPAMLGVWIVIELTTPHMNDWFAIEQMTMPAFDIGLTAAIVFLLPLLTSFIGRPSTTPSLAGKAGGGSFLFLQYFISLTLVTMSLYYMLQLHQMTSGDPGYKSENILVCTPYPLRPNPNYRDPKINEWFQKMMSDGQTLIQRLNECPHIKDWHLRKGLGTNDIKVNGIEMEKGSLSDKSVELLGLSILEGRGFSDTLDTERQYRCILNETAVRRLGIKDWRTEKILPEKRLWTLLDEGYRIAEEQPLVPYEIVGIIRDYTTGRLSEPMPAVMYTYSDDKGTNLHGVEMLLDVLPGHEKEVIRYMENVAGELFPGEHFQHHWLQDEQRDLYREDRRMTRIFFTFALLAIGVTCLGVLGLMMFDVRRRYREIALRKVHGARFRDIALLLSRRYLIILGMAAAVSIPVSLIGLHQLITRYYTIHATIAWWIPLVSLVLVFLLSALTLWHQIWRATKIEPSIVMKVE